LTKWTVGRLAPGGRYGPRVGETRTYVHAARARLEPGGDPAALGAAVTVGLCGSWEHDGPCVWPHHSATGAAGDLTTVRTVFRARPEHEADVRRLADAALRTGRQAGPDGSATVWTLLDSGLAEPTAEEASLGDRLDRVEGSRG
jgi:hypothetical protein